MLFLHGTQPQSTLSIATSLVSTVARLRVGDAEQGQARFEARGIKVETIDTAAEGDQGIATGTGNERGHVLRHLPDLHVLADQPQGLFAGDIDPVQRLGRRVPERTFTKSGAVLGYGGPRHVESFLLLFLL